MSNKKVKLQDDFSLVRSYILACPHVPNNHPAIRAAVQALDQELKRQERDAKLHQKFMNDAVTVERPTNTDTIENDTSPIEQVTRPNDRPQAQTNIDEQMADDWHDVTGEDHQEEDSNSYLGKQLAKQAVELLAQHCVLVKTPIQAIAVVLHAAMRSLNFACTGVPEDAKNNGFASPIRELPSSQFLPPKWDANKDTVSLRYRKNGTGSTILFVSLLEENKVQVSLYPSSSPEPQSQSLEFPLTDHLNLDSWNRARREDLNAGIAPSLHYKALSTLLATFCSRFDLGAVDQEDQAQQSLPYVDTTIQSLPSYATRPSTIIRPNEIDDATAWEVPRTIDRAFPARHPMGDFAGDLTPGGITGPYFGRLDPSQAGNLMGPNHPAFRGGVSGVGDQSGFGMQPRFDPFGPPGGPQDPRGIPNNRQRPPPGGSGVPNPDHMRPPNNLGNNMFL